MSTPFNGKLEILNADAKETILLNGREGNIRIGGHGESGSILLYNKNGKRDLGTIHLLKEVINTQKIQINLFILKGVFPKSPLL